MGGVQGADNPGQCRDRQWRGRNHRGRARPAVRGDGLAGFCFAGRDPYGGTAALRFGTPQSRRREFIIGGPLPGPKGALAEILHIAFLMNRGTAAHVVDAQPTVLPQLTEYTAHVSSVLQDAARRDDYLCQRSAESPHLRSLKFPT